MRNSTSLPWPKYPAVYEINTRVWLAELSGRAGHSLTLAHVPDEDLERIASLGFHAVWLMGVWTVGPEAITVARTDPEHLAEYGRCLPGYTTEDIIGSPYAI